MYRSFAMAVIALALVSLPAETSLASPGGRAGTATPAVKKLSPKGGAACFRNCMHGVSGAGWGNFCDSACYGH
jgi:hypothetical protein